MAGLERSNLAAIETHSREPTVGTLLRLAVALECTVDDLIEVEDAGPQEMFVFDAANLHKENV